MTAGSSWQHQSAQSWTLFWYSVSHLCLVTKISCSAIRVLPEETIYSTYARQTYKSKILKHILQNEYATHIIESASFRLRKEWTIELPNQFGEKKFRNHPNVHFYITRDHKVVFIPWDFSFMNPLYIKGVYACGHKIFPLVLEGNILWAPA